MSRPARTPRTSAAPPATALAATLALAACGSPEEGGAESAGAGAVEDDGVLTVAVTPVPHATILEYVDTELAPQVGLDLEIVEFTDYVQPNVALDEGAVDANYYQHGVFLADQEQTGGYDFSGLGPISFQPMGLYSDSVTDLAQLPQGATVAIPNDPVNGSRGLKLLAAEGVITLADPDVPVPTLLDVVDNPFDLRFEEVEAAQLPRSLTDVDLAAVPGNYALEVDLSPAQDALTVEDTDDTTYANQLVVRSADQDDPQVRQLLELLTSEEVRTFIDETYEGAVVAAF